jgi:hypothetical protein
MPTAPKPDVLPTHCRKCGNELLLRRPGRDLCARCHPRDQWWSGVPTTPTAPPIQED